MIRQKVDHGVNSSGSTNYNIFVTQREEIMTRSWGDIYEFQENNEKNMKLKAREVAINYSKYSH